MDELEKIDVGFVTVYNEEYRRSLCVSTVAQGEEHGPGTEETTGCL